MRSAKLQLALVALAALLPTCAVSQDAVSIDPNEAPLGDVARSLRKKGPRPESVIDDDNFSKMMEQAENRHAPGNSFQYLMAGESKGFQVAAPDATCSLSFNSNAKSLLSSQYAQMDLPPGEVLKLQGPAAIEGDALTVSVQNGTNWHVSELAVALTVVKKSAAGAEGEMEVRPEKNPDSTVIYRMRAAAPPTMRTVFSAPVSLDLAPGDEWHWAIVQAKGYPPQNYVASGAAVDQIRAAQPEKPVIPLSLLETQTQSAPPVSFAGSSQ